MSGDPEQEYFADGMVEEIITALSRIRWLFVIARNSSFTYKGQAVDVKQVGRELGVRYVLEGSVRKAGGRVRITAQLIDALQRHASLGRPLRRLARRRVRAAGQGRGQRRPASSSRPCRPPRSARSAARPTHDLTAYDLYLRALRPWGSLQKDGVLQALDLLARAIERDPHYGPALAWPPIAIKRSRRTVGWTIRRPTAVKASISHAGPCRSPPTTRQFSLTPGSRWRIFGEDIDVAVGLVDRSLSLNPSFARGW